MDKLYSLTAAQMKDLLDKKEVSSVEITKSVIDRIEKTDKDIQAYITYNFDQALLQAEAADEKRAKGEYLGELAGIPVALKDNMCTKNLRTTAGSKILGNFVPPYNATVVEKLIADGAVIIGKTTMDEFAMGSSGENSAFQVARNPWDITRVPGGSSSGSAATVAASQVPLALGSDTGGSIRQPASLCGIVGMKPTYGSVSRYGLIAYGSSLDQIGPMARTVDDAAMLFKAICGRDTKDATSKNYEYRPYGDSVKGMKLGLPKEYFGEGISAEVKEKIYEAVETLKAQGAEIVEVSLPSTDYALSAYYIIACAEASSNLGRFDGVKYGFTGSDRSSLENLYLSSRSEGFGEEVQRRILLGTYVLSSGFYDAYYKKAKMLQKVIRKEFEDALKQCDAIITPLSPTTAFKIGEKSNDPVAMWAADICTVTLNIAGLPGINVPCGFDSNNMPVGFQVLGPKFSESTLLTIAKCYENTVGGFAVKEF
ncbi:MAG: Asp-tRNA(Asn)/Glu-tRNA(Gln) amidotransferase subunit GatA [Oscillospiraceae bacterium]|nr:Asp-tRNA(Asn)/Glu-tRNA(Gln) amidotransferase subunit GatA [Oscillospiraceae bacterium]